MTRRTQSMYVAIFTTLVERASLLPGVELEPSVIVTDFEKAAMNAFAEIFTRATVNGCHFHLCQSVLRKVNELGLKPSTSEMQSSPCTFVCWRHWPSFQSLQYHRVRRHMCCYARCLQTGSRLLQRDIRECGTSGGTKGGPGGAMAPLFQAWPPSGPPIWVPGKIRKYNALEKLQATERRLQKFIQLTTVNEIFT